MAISVFRPTHTGSARRQALEADARAARAADRRPGHVRMAGAAVALERSSQDRPAFAVRRAARPLALGGGRQALAVRRPQEGKGLEVLVRDAQGVAYWRAADLVLTPAQARQWVQQGFDKPG